MKSGDKYFGKRVAVVFGLFVILSTVIGCMVSSRSILAQASTLRDSVYNDVSARHYVFFQTSDGAQLSGWFYDRGEGSELVVCYPGNACNAGMFIEYAEADVARSYLMLNYRGYGSSSSLLSEENMVQDAKEALLHFSGRIKAEKVTLLGFSLGTGVAVQVAASGAPVARLVLAAPFDSMAHICGISGVGRLLTKDHFDSVRFAPDVTCPVFVVYSREDSVVPPCNTGRLLSAFNIIPSVKVVNGTHGEVISHPDNRRLIIDVLNSWKN